MLKFRKSVIPLIFLVSITILFGFAQEASAAVQTLTDENTVVMIEDGAGGSNAGVISYTVDGVNNMVQEAWWFSLGTVAVPLGTIELPIASQGVASVVVTDEDLDGDDDKLVITFLTPNCFNFGLTFELTGGAPGSGIANLRETVTGGGICGGFLNSYQYTNYDADGITINTSVRTASNIVGQGVSGPPFSTTTTYSDTNQQPFIIELGLASDLLARLDDGDADVFVDTPVSSGFGPGDGAFVSIYANSMLAVFPFGVPLLGFIDKEIQVNLTVCQSDIQCDDNNACTTDVCINPPNGQCSNTAVVCDDNDACNGLETCDTASGCVGGTALNCDDLEFCTLDSCNPATGCVNAPNPDPLCERVGGEFIGVDNSALLVAGFQANALWLLPAIAAIGIAAVVIRRIH